jgi:acyl-CoA reductase-like NAD-dependent aldehyde dehydrogenase
MAKIDYTKFRNLIAGTLRSGAKTTRGINPTNRKPLCEVPIASNSDLEDAVSAAHKSWPSWSHKSWAERQSCLTKARELLQENRANMAELISREVGRPMQFAHLEVEHAVNFLDFYGATIQPCHGLSG